MTSDASYPHIRRDNRYARYQAIRALQQQGFSLREISRRLKLSRQTVRRFVRAESFPERSKAAKKASLLDPYKPSLLKGIHRDYAAVHAAFSSKWSNGQVEGHVNGLKLHKRQMYGRAQFDLLRLRVLHAV